MPSSDALAIKAIVELVTTAGDKVSLIFGTNADKEGVVAAFLAAVDG